MKQHTIPETERLTYKKKTEYLSYVILSFFVSFIAAIIVFQGSPVSTAISFIMLLFFILSVLTFTFLLVKFFFFVHGNGEKDEFKLEEIPKDQEDIQKSH
jgi:uncharacterized Tic20 family protein